MPTYKIRGIDVEFPYDAYDCQLVYMEKVIQSLQSKCNALLESPTGTGKTLCLLCATLAWRKSLGGFSTGMTAAKGEESKLSQSMTCKLPPIVYTSRTHSQLRQVIQELKKTTYRPKMAVLGSREQLCIHDEVSQLRGKAQTNACQFVCRKRKKNRCAHYPRVANFMKNNPDLGDEPIDIEELVNIGRRSCGPCPYYVSKELHKVADILFAPYNYLIDRGYRKSLSLNWDSSILIFDEAHNLESLCAEAASFDLPSGLLTACISEVKKCFDISISRRDKSNDKSCKSDNFSLLKALLLKLEKQIAEVPIESKEFGFTKPGPYIYQLLAELNINYDTASKIIDTIEEGLLLLEEDATGGVVNQKVSGNTWRLESMNDIFRTIFRDKTNAHAKFYRVHVQDVEGRGTDFLKGKASRTFSWWCFNPGIALEEFSSLGVGSIILTSGTLSPMDSFAHELRLDFPIRLENPHVISPSQIWAGVVSAGPSGCPFNSSYRNRESLEYKQELGNAIVNFARIVPDGLLVFFPSYYLLEQCIGCWKNVGHGNSINSSSIWERICRHKQPVVEPRQSSLFLSSIDEYMTKLKDTSTSGAIFFAVCRGKVSEGLDFADHAGRAVVVTGMPFATRTDPKVRLKREYLDHEAQSQMEASKALTGEDWYSQQAIRAVNQAVGRVIRHRHDYGAIIFCDERFAYSNRQSQISLWIRPHIQCYSKFGDVVFSLTRFFRDGGSRGPRKLELTQTTENRNLIDRTDAQALDKLCLEKFVTPQNTPKGQDCSTQSLSSLLEVKRGSTSGQFVEVLPANRSSLNPHLQNQAVTLKYSSNLFYKEKNLTTGRKDVLCQNRDVVDLTLDEKPSKELIASCSEKKRKLLIGEPDAGNPSKTHEHSSVFQKPHFNYPSIIANSMTHEKSQTSSSTRDDETGRRIDAEFLDQKNKNLSPPGTGGEEETRGSAFLLQVREKLSAAEYKDFVEFMKALKSKAMKIGHVLQSIAKLFSGPERLHLRKRFKDYIPAKYHSLYEKYLESNDEGADNLS